MHERLRRIPQELGKTLTEIEPLARKSIPGVALLLACGLLPGQVRAMEVDPDGAGVMVPMPVRHLAPTERIEAIEDARQIEEWVKTNFENSPISPLRDGDGNVISIRTKPDLSEEQIANGEEMEVQVTEEDIKDYSNTDGSLSEYLSRRILTFRFGKTEVMLTTGISHAYLTWKDRLKVGEIPEGEDSLEDVEVRTSEANSGDLDQLFNMMCNSWPISESLSLPTDGYHISTRRLP